MYSFNVCKRSIENLKVTQPSSRKTKLNRMKRSKTKTSQSKSLERRTCSPEEKSRSRRLNGVPKKTMRWNHMLTNKFHLMIEFWLSGKSMNLRLKKNEKLLQTCNHRRQIWKTLEKTRRSSKATLICGSRTSNNCKLCTRT